jgi:hypothetical protein
MKDSSCWWITSGVGNVCDRQVSRLPPGVGMSDLRVTLGSATDKAAGPFFVPIHRQAFAATQE